MYSDGEALILTLVRTVTNYGASNTSRGKYGILNSGNSSRYAILKPGPFSRSEQGSGLMFESKWSTAVELWHRYVDDGSTLTNLEADAGAIIAMIDAHRLLGDNTGKVRDATARRGNEVEELWAQSGDGPVWLRWKIYVTWDEETSVTPAE